MYFYVTGWGERGCSKQFAELSIKPALRSVATLFLRNYM